MAARDTVEGKIGAELSIECEGQRHHPEIETVAFHQDSWRRNDDALPAHRRSRAPDTVEKACWQWEVPDGTSLYRIILEAEEISLAEAARAVRRFCENRGVRLARRPHDEAQERLRRGR